MMNKKIIFLSGVLFYGALNLIFTFHLKVDDFSYQWLYWACAPACTWRDVLDVANLVRNPIFYLQYLMIKISPTHLNGFFFLFQLLHTLNAILLFKFIEKHFESQKLAFLTAIFFLFYPNNFEILYWRSCIFYVAGMTCALLGLLYYSRWSSLLWLISFIFYESFAFLPLLLPAVFFALGRGDKRQLIRFLIIYGASCAGYLLLRLGSSYFAGAAGLRYPLDFGHYGLDIVKKTFDYFSFHVSIRSSLKNYELLTWTFRVLIAISLWQNREWVKQHRRTLMALLVVYVIVLSPVLLVSHPAPRGSFAATLVFSLLLAYAMSRSHFGFHVAVVVLFVIGHVLGAQKINFNSDLYRTRVDKIKSVVSELPEDKKVCIEVQGFEQGYRKEWFLQAGFSLQGLSVECRHFFKDKDFYLTSDCGGYKPRRTVTFP